MEKETKHINKGFLSNYSKYEATVKNWDKKVLNVLQDKDNYEAWFENKINGKFIMNGNPIYSLIKKDKSKALRITQVEPRSSKPYMYCYTDYYTSEKENKIPFLEISLELSNKTEMESLNLIELWFVKYEKNIFERAINKINSRYEKNYVKSDYEMALEAYDEIKELEKELENRKADLPKESTLSGSVNVITTFSNHWTNALEAPVSSINPDLASAITIQITLLRGLVTMSGQITATKEGGIRASKILSNIIKHYYNNTHFVMEYKRVNDEIGKLSDELFENLSEVEVD